MNKPIPTVIVDFNNDNDEDVIQALLTRVSDPSCLAVGVALRLLDREGNRCLGCVVKLDDKSVWARADYNTWQDSSEARS